MYDIIGDIHGHASRLERLLERMGYERDADSWRHPDRQAIFVGDFIPHAKVRMPITPPKHC